MLVQGRYVVRKIHRDKHGTYGVTVRDKSTGTVHRRSLYTKKLREAEANLMPVVEELIRSITKDESPDTAMAFGEAAESLLKSRSNVAPSTFKDYKTMSGIQVKFFGADTPLERITKDQLARFMNSMINNGKSSRTISKHLTFTSAVFRWGEVKYPGENLVKPRGGQRERRALEASEITGILAKSEGWFRVMAMLMVYTGMRPGNAIRLEWRHVDLDEGLISVPAAEMKGRRDWFTVIHPVLKKALLEAKISSKSSRVIGKSVTKADKPFKKVCTELGISDAKNLCPYNLRHTFNTTIAPLCEEVIRAALMGHKSSQGDSAAQLGTRYYHARAEHLWEVILKLPDFTASQTAVQSKQG